MTRTTHATKIVDEIEAAFLDAAAFVTDLRDARPNDIHGDAELERAVWDEALRTLACRAEVREYFVRAFAPVPCDRPGCPNDGVRSPSRQVWGGVWCSGPCFQWHRRDTVRGRRVKQRVLVAA